VFFSDLHVDPLFSKQKLVRLGAELDSIAPDFLLFGGDLADVNDKALSEMGYDSLFRRLTQAAKVAAIGINGNHEAYAERSGSEPENWMRRNGMIVLDDSTICTSLACFTGRTDFQVARVRAVERKSLKDLLPSDSAKPWILLDHQPKGIESEYRGRLPLLGLSGHTHNGQFFPATALIGFFWRLSDGLGTLDKVPWIVSSGIDSWGPPVRVGSRTDVWVIHLEPIR
jgi:predicted MPP superfamily phosphohydrolase